MILLPFLQRSVAYTRDNPISFMRYAMTNVEDLETPAQQWTNTVPPDLITEAIQLTTSLKYRERSWLGESRTFRTLYWNLPLNIGSMPPRA